MDLGLTDRVAIIGGTGLELGEEIAKALAKEGAKIVLCSDNPEGLHGAETEVVRIATQHKVLAIPADLTEPRDIRRVVRDAVNRFGQIDILVNRTRQPNHGLLADVDDSDIAEEIERHLLSAVRLTREVIPYMKQEHWGRIINLDIASCEQVMNGANGLSGRQLYLIGYFKTLAQELAPFNITVNSLLAGALDTQELRQFGETQARGKDGDPADFCRQVAKYIPMKRLGKPEEIGEMVALLASGQTGYLTGASLAVDGGRAN